MRSIRALRRCAALFWIATLAHADYWRLRSGAALSVRARAEWLSKWCARLLPRLGIHLSVAGPLPKAGMIVANHVSYLDIVVLSATAPCAFVSKHEIRKWPLFGRFSRMASTVFIDRTRKSDAGRATVEVEKLLQQGALVVLFPESTSSDGTEVLPFRSPLFEAAVASRTQITPAHLAYELPDGDASAEVAYWGEMTFLPHFLRLLGKQKIFVRLRFGMPESILAGRKDAAQKSRDAVVALARA